MNRLRHAYLELAPELEPYFVTAHHDDAASVLNSYGPGVRMRLSRFLAGTPNLVAAINVVVVGVLAALIADTSGAQQTVTVAAGVVAALVAAVGFGALAFRTRSSALRAYRPRFPR
jgi:uncharacterized membrane protein YeaQ/YmgE (transglycosylase-associated protein family)